MYQFEYELNNQDFVDFLLHHFMTTKEYSKNLLLLKIVHLVLYTLAIILFLHLFQGVFALIPIFVVLIISFFQFKNLPQTMLKSYRKSVYRMIAGDKAKRTLGHKKFTMNENEIIFEESLSSSSLQKCDIHKIDETETSIFIFVDEISAIIIPKRVFDNEKDIEDFRHALNRKL